MKKLFRLSSIIGAAVLVSALTGCGGIIDQGNVGVRTSFGHVDPQPVGTGFYTTFLSHVAEYTGKETTVQLDGMKPRAHDNLTLQDLDATVYYQANGIKLPEFQATHAGQSAELKGDSFIRPGYVMIDNLARGVVNDEVSKFDSLTLHQNRQPLEQAVKKALQADLDARVPGVFTVNNVVVRNIQTDPAVEQSIRDSAAATKRLETTTKLVQVKQQEALANEKLAQSLTPAFLQHEYNEALNKCAANSNCTMVVGSDKAIVNVKK